MMLAGRYQVGEKLVEDGLGELYRARDTLHDRPVTLRLMTSRRPEEVDTKRQRLVREARILGSGRHPGLVSVYDLDIAHDPPYFVLEPLDGEPLATWMARGQIPKVDVWYSWMHRLLGALGEVHRQGYLHRHLAPEYMFLTSSGLKLFGLGGARSSDDPNASAATMTTSLVPRYYAPELMLTSRADARSDLYSAAAVGFRILTGVDPVPLDDVKSPGAAIDRILNATRFRASQVRPDLGRPFDVFFERMLSIAPEARPGSAQEAQRMLNKLREHPGAGARRDSVRVVKASDNSEGALVARIGDSIAGFRVLGKLGAGGMGAVLLARDDENQRNVALKVLGHLHSETQRRALYAEAEAMERISHPNVVKVYGISDHRGHPVVVMEYVAGETVEEYLLERGSPPLDLTLSILEQTATGLAAVHAQGLIHGDIKTSNVLLGPAGRVWVADFGLVTQRETFEQRPIERFEGTPEYLAPERVTGPLRPEYAHRMDVYSLAVMAFEMLAYRRLYGATSVAEQVAAHVHQAPPRLGDVRPDLPPALSEVIARALHKDPALRTESCLAFRTELLKACEAALPAPSPAHRLLLIDGDPEFCEAVTRVIAGALEGASVSWAHDGSSATQALQEGTFDLVLLDLDLADTNAVELSAWMRNHLSEARMPKIMAITATQGAADWQVLHALGVSAFHLKPVTPDVLVHSVRRALGATALEAAP